MTAPVAAAYSPDADRGTGDQGGQFVKQGTNSSRTSTKTPQPRRRAPVRRPTGKLARTSPGKPGKAPAKSSASPAAIDALPKAPPPLRQGIANDPARVKQVQALLADLGLGKMAIDGSYGQATEDAVKEAQRRLGLKPTGRAGVGLIRKLAEARRLSPCVKGGGSSVTAAAPSPVDESDLDDEDLTDDAEYVDTVLGDAFDLIVWSDGTVWLSDDGETGLVELDYEEAGLVAGAVADLGDGPVEVSDWLSVYADGARLVLAAACDGEDDVEVEISAADAGRLGEFAGVPVPVAAALGKDVTPGHDELHHYWTRGEGLAKWVNSPTPWTTLLGLLVEHVKPPKPLSTLKKWASAWFIEVKGYAAGSDLNRVAHGKPPRGHLVGPG